MSAARFVLGHDVGTSGDKAVLCDLGGRTVASAARGYGIARPRPGWVQQDPEELVAAVIETSRELAGAARREGGEIVAMGVSGQMFNVVAVDAMGAAVYPMLSWLDARASPQASRIAAAIDYDQQYARFGSVFTAKDIVPKILWLQEEAPDVAERVELFLDCKDYINARLTRHNATDHAGASAYFLYDVRRREWDEDGARQLGIATDMLPYALPATQPLAGLGDIAADAMGLPPQTPVAVCAGDVPAGQVGAGAARPGQAHLSLGTASYFGISLDAPLRDPGRRLGVLCHMDPTRWLLWAEMETGGGALAWWRNVLNGARPGELVSPADADRLAMQVAPNESDVLFAPWLTGERVPLWDDHARAAFVGIGIDYGLPHLTRSVMEGVAYQLRWVLEYAEAFGVSVGEVRLIGGAGLGAVLPQVLADVIGRPLDVVAEPQQAGARGAALCALAASNDASLDDLADATPLAARIEPDRTYRGLYDERFARFTMLHERLAALGQAPAGEDATG